MMHELGSSAVRAHARVGVFRQKSEAAAANKSPRRRRRLHDQTVEGGREGEGEGERERSE